MQEENSTEETIEKTKKKMKVSFRWFFRSLWDLTVDTFSVRHDADIEGTVETIKKDVEFRGHNVWILIFSILIASIGLNVNSVAVIIGAMLISPLMGPILGIGYGLGTNDIDTLIISIKNTFVAVLVSIVTSYLYFKFSPFTEEQPELLSRTKPQLLDVLVSIFGGLAGIIANSRKERTNVIPGVAIATALMPPLCTAGYGLAIGNYEYFLGAFYLFLLNAAGITVTTLLVVKYMRFPLVHFIDPSRERKVKWFVAFFWILLVVPSCFMFYNILNETIFKRKAKNFVNNEIKYEKTYLVKDNYEYHIDSISVINLYFYGEILDSAIEVNLNDRLKSYGLESSSLIIHQDEDNSEEFQEKLKNVQSNYDYLFDETTAAIEFQNDKIAEIQSKMVNRRDSISLIKLDKECKILFPQITQLAYSEMEYLINYDSTIIVPTFYIQKKKRSTLDDKKLRKWLKERSERDTINLIY